MFIYVFLISALIASAPEVSTPIDSELQEIIALFTSEETNIESSPASSCARSELVEEYPRALEETLLPQFSFHSKPGTPSKETEDGDKTVQGEREKTKILSSESNNLRSIIITNAIEPSMLAYKHWTGTYNPDIFTIKINGVEVAQGEQHTLPASKDPIEIRFDYSFVNGKRTGAKVVSYQLNENIETAKITFSWLDDWRVLVDNGTPVKQEEITA